MSIKRKRTGLRKGGKRRAGVLVGLFFFALSVPTLVLVYKAYSQLKWEAFYNYRILSEELALRIDKNLFELIAREEDRSFGDYSFIVATGNAANNYVQRSPLSELPLETEIPGFIGYFQVDPKGDLTSPLLPTALPAGQFGLAPAQVQARREQQDRILSILSENQLIARQPLPMQTVSQMIEMATPAGEALTETDDSLGEPEAYNARSTLSSQTRDDVYTQERRQKEAQEEMQVESQAAFDNLARLEIQQAEKKTSLGRLEDLHLDKSQFRETKPATKANPPAARMKQNADSTLGASARFTRKEISVVPEAAYAPQPAEQSSPGQENAKVKIFESEIDPFEVSLLDSGHFVVYRKVWREGKRYIQGFLLDRKQMIGDLVENEFRATRLSNMSNLAVAFRGNVLAAFADGASPNYLSRSEQLTGALLYQTRLSAPFNELELVFTVNRMPAGKGAVVVSWSAGIILLVLLVGCWLFYRMVTRQMELAGQQQDFVSSVSHELRTPLTSIRMYGEMLKQGWASEEKKTEYYDFIYHESERLTRLINNVLQLARMTRNDLPIDLKPYPLSQLSDMVRSKIASQVERAGFVSQLHMADEDKETAVCVDADMFVQIVINLVDNAIKFSAKSETKKIEISFKTKSNNRVLVSVRDYGPGIPDRQLKKIFTLFYRLENEMTRETTGTGIGLALVNQLTQSMNGTIDVINRKPGAEFLLEFPVHR